MIVSNSSFFSKWLHWLKREDQRPSCAPTETQHLFKPCYGIWPSLRYLNRYTTSDIDWKISKCGFLNHSSLLRQICSTASPMMFSSHKQFHFLVLVYCLLKVLEELLWSSNKRLKEKKRTFPNKFFTTGFKKTCPFFLCTFTMSR